LEIKKRTLFVSTTILQNNCLFSKAIRFQPRAGKEDPTPRCLNKKIFLFEKFRLFSISFPRGKVSYTELRFTWLKNREDGKRQPDYLPGP
jgi:hypothetical protein